MHKADYLGYVYRMHALPFVTAACLVCGHLVAQVPEPANRLVVMKASGAVIVEFQGKEARTASLFGEAKQQDIVDAVYANQAGQVICHINAGIWLRQERIGAVEGPLVLTESKIPYHANMGCLQGSLSPSGNKFCFKTVREPLTPTAKVQCKVYDCGSSDVEDAYTTIGQGSEPAWSLDERSVAYYFRSNKDSEPPRYSLGVETRTDGVWKHLTVAPESSKETVYLRDRPIPIWGPNAQTLLFMARYNTNEDGGELLDGYLVNRDGKGLTKICSECCGLSVVPGKRKIVYSSRLKGVFFYDMDTKEHSMIIGRKAGDLPACFPQLSPDGKLLAYVEIPLGSLYVVEMQSLGEPPRKVLNDAQIAPTSSQFFWLNPAPSGALVSPMGSAVKGASVVSP